MASPNGQENPSSLCIPLMKVGRVDAAPDPFSGFQKGLLCVEMASFQTSPICPHMVLLVFCYYFMRKGEARN